MFSVRKLILFVFLLLLLAYRFELIYQDRSNYVKGQAVVLETRLLAEPTITGNFQRFSVSKGFGDRLFITTSRFPEYRYGQDLKISGTIEFFQPQKAFNVSNQQNKLLKNEKPMVTMFLPKIEAKENSLAVLSSLRQELISLFEKVLPPDSSSLLLGIVFGIKTQMSDTFNTNLKNAGVMHVIAASGMNVTMVGGFLSSIFLIFFKRQYALILSIAGLFFYAFLSGLQPSIVRATIMGTLAFSAQIWGRQNLPIYALGLAGYGMLFIEPSLVLDIGFQLSFLSTLGLIYIKPLFSIFSKTKILGLILTEDISTTISAQIMTLPILLANFGSYSIFSVIVNGLVLWVVPYLMIIGGVGAIIGLLVNRIGGLILYSSLPLLLYFEKVVNVFSSLGGAIAINSFPWQLSLGYYLLLMAITAQFYKKKGKSA